MRIEVHLALCALAAPRGWFLPLRDQSQRGERLCQVERHKQLHHRSVTTPYCLGHHLLCYWRLVERARIRVLSMPQRVSRALSTQSASRESQAPGQDLPVPADYMSGEVLDVEWAVPAY